MELVIIALSIIFSVVALFTAIYTVEELIKLKNITEHVLDLAIRVIDDNDRMIKYIDVLEDRTKKED